MATSTGRITQIIGPVIDVEFDLSNDGNLPKIYDSLHVEREDGSLLVLEVQSHTGEGTVRTIAMDSADGLSRGVVVKATGAPIQMSIGENIYGRLFNVTGYTIVGNDNYSIYIK